MVELCSPTMTVYAAAWKLKAKTELIVKNE
jgi:hypothetical protein